ncbi:MAG: class C sortase [Firmicutes bacterium]|nr:class C sortase [Bacillota bacterium]
MKKHLFTIVIGLVFVLGLSIFLYPFVAKYVNASSQSRVVTQYYRAVQDLSAPKYKATLDEARAYNQKLAANGHRFTPTDKETAEYNKLLSLTQSGVMGTLSITKIRVRLPIYHGTSEGVLQVGVGHLEGSSLPVGGLGTHAALTGHRGLPSAILLTDLDQLTIGDTFVVRVLNEKLTYQVDQVLIVEPEDLGPLAIDPAQDYCTLVTCTPYGINSQRMLVRGHRIPNEQVTAEPADARAVKAQIVALILLLPVLIVLVIRLVTRYRTLYRKKRK